MNTSTYISTPWPSARPEATLAAVYPGSHGTQVIDFIGVHGERDSYLGRGGHISTPGGPAFRQGEGPTFTRKI